MGRSRLPVVISLFSLLAAAGSVVAMFSMRAARSREGSHLKAVTCQDDLSGAQTPVEINPADIKYRQVAEFPVEMKKVTALAVDADDRIYVAGDSCFCRYSPEGILEHRVSLAFEPTCITVGSRQHIAPGRVYVGFADHVEGFDPDLSKVCIWQGIDKASFTSISVSDTDIFIADNGWNVVQHFDSTGKLFSPIGDTSSGHFAPSPKTSSEHFDLVVSRDGLVYVVNRRECSVEGYDMSGKFERHWGQASPALEDFAGRNNPEQIALTESGFATAEGNPLRVKVYRRSGQFYGVVCGPKETGRVADLAVDRHNRVLVLDAEARRVRVFADKTAATK